MEIPGIRRLGAFRIRMSLFGSLRGRLAMSFAIVLLLGTGVAVSPSWR